MIRCACKCIASGKSGCFFFLNKNLKNGRWPTFFSVSLIMLTWSSGEKSGVYIWNYLTSLLRHVYVHRMDWTYSATATKSKMFDELFLPEPVLWMDSSSFFTSGEKKGLKFDLALKETDFFRLCAQQRREKNHIERDREKWRHKSFWH